MTPRLRRLRTRPSGAAGAALVSPYAAKERLECGPCEGQHRLIREDAVLQLVVRVRHYDLLPGEWLGQKRAPRVFERGLLINGRPTSAYNYYEMMLLKLSQVYTPEDIYINELSGGLSQLDAGVTTVMGVSQIQHSTDHSDAAYEGLRDAGGRAVLGYFEGWGDLTKYPADARRLREERFSSDDGLLTMVMGGEIYLPGYEESWRIGRELGLPIALHVVGTFGMQPTFDALGEAGHFGPDNIFIHMIAMSEKGWRMAADAGAHVSLSVPIEMQMRHGTPHDPAGARPWHVGVTVLGRGMHHDSRPLHADAGPDDGAAHVRQCQGPGRGGVSAAPDLHGRPAS